MPALDPAHPPPEQAAAVGRIMDMLRQRQAVAMAAGSSSGAVSVVPADADGPSAHLGYVGNVRATHSGIQAPARGQQQQQQQQQLPLAPAAQVRSASEAFMASGGSGAGSCYATATGSIGMVVSAGNAWAHAPQHPTAIAALRMSPMGMQPGAQSIIAAALGNVPTAPTGDVLEVRNRADTSHAAADGGEGMSGAPKEVSQVEKQQQQLECGLVKLLARPHGRGRRTLRPWPIVEVPPMPSGEECACSGGGADTSARPAQPTIADLVKVPPRFTFGAYDGHLTQHYEIPPSDVVVSIGAIRYIEHYNQCGPYSSYRFQICHNFYSGKCRKGAECTYLHMRRMPAPQLVHVMVTDDAAEEQRTYPMLPSGLMVPIYAPHSTEPPQIVPSQRIIQTAGSRLLLESLLSASPSEAAKKVAARPQHCAHFQFRKVCNRGAECSFIHCCTSLRPQVQGPLAARGAGTSTSSSRPVRMGGGAAFGASAQDQVGSHAPGAQPVVQEHPHQLHHCEQQRPQEVLPPPFMLQGAVWDGSGSGPTTSGPPPVHSPQQQGAGRVGASAAGGGGPGGAHYLHLPSSSHLCGTAVSPSAGLDLREFGGAQW